MGGTLSNKQEEIATLSQYRPVENIRDGHYGEIQLMENIQSQQIVAVKEAVSQNPEDIDRQANLLLKKKEKPHPNLINVFDLQVNNEDRLCSSVKRLVWIMEYIRRDLTVEIRGRRLQQNDFNEKEIWQITESCISGLSYLQQLNISHGDLRSSSIFVTNDFQIKISDPSIFNITPAYINCMTNGPKRGIYLSPQLMQSLKEKNWQPNYDKFKSDVFSLGIILIEAILLKHCDDAFDYEKGKIKVEVLENYFKLMQQKQQSEKLINIIRQMVHLDENQRPSFIELANCIGITINNQDIEQQLNKNSNQNIFKDITNKTNSNSSKGNYEDQPLVQNKQAQYQNQPSKLSVMEKIVQESNQQQKKDNNKQQYSNKMGISIHRTEQDEIGNEFNNNNQKENRLLTPQQSTEKPKPSEQSQLQINQNSLITQTQQEPQIKQSEQQDNQVIKQVEDISQQNITQDQVEQQPQQSDNIKYTNQNIVNQQLQYQQLQYQIQLPKEQNSLVEQSYTQQQQQQKTDVLSTQQNNVSYQNALIDPTFEYKIPDSIQKIIDEFKHKRTNSTNLGQQPPTQAQFEIQQMQQQQINQQNQAQQQNQQYQQQQLTQTNTNQSYYQNYQINDIISPQNFNNNINQQQQQQQAINNSNNRLNQINLTHNLTTISNQNNNNNSSSYSDNFEAEQIKICEQLRNNQQYQEQQQQQFLDQEVNHQDQQQQQIKQPELQHQQILDNQFYEDQNNEQQQQQFYQSEKYERIQETYEDGSIYDGEKLNNMRHGQGKFFYADGGFYDGEWKFGRMEGLGTLYYPSERLAYLGQWKDDKFNGKGTVYNESPQQIQGTFEYTNFDQLGEYWVKYEGDFIDDNKEGFGTLTLSNGDRFVGSFSNDLVHGQGCYYNAQGESLAKGYWDQNRFVE